MADDTYPELLLDVADQVARRLAEDGIDPERASEIGFAVAEHLRQHYSGQPLYLPKGLQYTLSRRDAEIYHRFSGDNHLQLAKEYGLTVVRIYQILKRAREQYIRDRQSQLFED